MSIAKIAAVTVFVVATPDALAQHQDHAAPPSGGEARETSTPHAAHGAEAGVLGIPMTRHGSGTAWLPDASPMRAFHGRVAGWDVMAHGNLFVGYDVQGSDAGASEIVSQNWLMLMASHGVMGGVFVARTMLSAEPLTLGDNGYPLLMQTGETLDGEPLVDRQHPHDLFMEIAADYQRELAGGLALELYGGLAGEPALGPVGFPHRPSAMPDPLAPLSHHWQDSTHITFGVLTAGLFTRFAKLEASWFNGREPDEERYDIDLRGFDSFSTRLSVNPGRHWSVQASYGYLDSPEALEPAISVQRATASATHAFELGARRSWTSTAAWGRNIPSDGHDSDSLLVETAADLGRYGVTFARAEYVMKSGHDFDFAEEMEELELPVSSLSLGHVQPVLEIEGVETALGVRGSVGYVADELEPRYGTRTPLGMMAYLQVQPAAMP
jgi:hypothetical protein